MPFGKASANYAAHSVAVAARSMRPIPLAVNSRLECLRIVAQWTGSRYPVQVIHAIRRYFSNLR